ncbi:MAG: hypothetical protein Q9214_002768 [Letrouitia sp. 1 TL-2023]
MYSLSYLYQALGDRAFADQCERNAFNALPAAFTHDHWGHQYLTVTNQPFTCKLEDPNPFWNTGKQSIMYGIEPNYPCCTVNFPQGLPKFLSSSFAHFGSNGLVHALLSPARVATKLPNGAMVNLTCETAYPFGPNLYYEIVASEPFTLHLRIPAWVNWYEMSASSGRDKMPWSPDDPQEIHTSDTLVLDPNTGLLSVDLLQYSRVSLTLTTSIRTEPRDNDTVAIYYGALLYALDVGQETTHIKLNSSRIDTTSHAFPAKDAHDYNITNTKPWAIAIDPSTLVYHGPGAGPHSSIDDSNKNSSSASTMPRPKQPELKTPIWDYEAPPNYITVKTCEILWNLDKGIPSTPSPIDQRICVEGTVRERVLRPYGSLKVHMAELPVMDLSGFD